MKQIFSCKSRQHPNSNYHHHHHPFSTLRPPQQTYICIDVAQYNNTIILVPIPVFVGLAVFHGHRGGCGIPPTGAQPDSHMRQGPHQFLDTGCRRYPVQAQRNIRDHPRPSQVRDVLGVHAERRRLVRRLERIRSHMGTR